MDFHDGLKFLSVVLIDLKLFSESSNCLNTKSQNEAGPSLKSSPTQSGFFFPEMEEDIGE